MNVSSVLLANTCNVCALNLFFAKQTLHTTGENASASFKQKIKEIALLYFFCKLKKEKYKRHCPLSEFRFHFLQMKLWWLQSQNIYYFFFFSCFSFPHRSANFLSLKCLHRVKKKTIETQIFKPKVLSWQEKWQEQDLNTS